MFRKPIIIRGLILLLTIGVLASLGWAEGQKAEKEGERIAEKEEIKSEPTKKESQKGTLTEEYVMKEILFIPWGKGEGKIGLREVEYLVQGIETVTTRYGATKLEVDKDGNLYIWDNVAYPPLDSSEKIIKKPKSNKILKFVKEKKKGEGTEEYKYVESIPLILTLTPLKGLIEEKPFKVEKFKSGYRYEDYQPKEKEIIGKIGFKIIEENTSKVVKEIYYPVEDDDEIYIATLVGDDINKNIYVLIDNTSWKGGNTLKIYKYSQEGNLLTKIKLLSNIEYTDIFEGQRKRIAIDKDGNIYQLLPKEDGVHILKWEVK